MKSRIFGGIRNGKLSKINPRVGAEILQTPNRGEGGSVT